MGKNKDDFKKMSGKEKFQTVIAAIIIGAIFLLIVSDCSRNSLSKASTRGLIISP